MFQPNKPKCSCVRERSYLMLIWGRHYQGCRVVRRWPGVGVPLLVFAALLPGVALADGWGEALPDKFCHEADRPTTAALKALQCAPPTTAVATCRKWMAAMPSGHELMWFGTGWVAECKRKQ